MDNLFDPTPSPLPLGTLVWRHKGKMLLSFLAVVGLTLVYLSTTERTFVSEAKIMVRLGRESVTLDPIVTNGQVVTVTDARESEVTAISEILKSRAVLEQVVDQLTPQIVLTKPPGAKSLGDRLAVLDRLNLNPFKVYSLRDKAIKRLEKQLQVLPTKRSSIITLTFESPDSNLSATVLQSLIQVARSEHLKVNHTTGSHEFYESQKGLLHKKLAQIEDELRRRKSEGGLAQFEKQRDIHLTHIGALETNLATSQTQLRAAEAEAENRRTALAKLPALVETSQISDQPNEITAEMRKKLYDLQVKESELSAKFKDDSPLLLQVRDQIAAAKKVMDDEEQKKQKTMGSSKVHEAVAQALLDREAEVVSLRAKVGDLDAKIAEARSKLQGLIDTELELARLQREVDLTSANYKKYADNLELARINDEVEAAKISSINLFQPPSASETPASPNLLMTMAMGAVGGILAGLTVALMADSRRRSQQVRRRELILEAPEVAAPPATVPRPRRAETALPSQPR